MPVEHTAKAKRQKDRESVTLAEVEELCIAARHLGAGDDALLKVNVMIDFRSPAAINEAHVVW